jgi:hypothetical protein
MADLSTADPVAVVLSWLRQHSRIISEFGGPEYLSGLNEAPYPHVRVAPGPGGSDRGLRWLIAPEVLIEVYGSQAGEPGSAELRRLLYVVLTATKELEARQPAPGEPVVTAVNSANNAISSPLVAPAQPRWLAAIQVFLHPAPD